MHLILCEDRTKNTTKEHELLNSRKKKMLMYLLGWKDLYWNIQLLLISVKGMSNKTQSEYKHSLSVLTTSFSVFIQWSLNKCS